LSAHKEALMQIQKLTKWVVMQYVVESKDQSSTSGRSLSYFHYKRKSKMALYHKSGHKYVYVCVWHAHIALIKH